jgi:hypothetical protein
VELADAAEDPTVPVASPCQPCEEERRLGKGLTIGEARTAPKYRPLHGDASGDRIAPPSEESVREAEVRELEYSWAGGYHQVAGDLPTAMALADVRGVKIVNCDDWESLRGRNNLMACSGDVARRYAERWAALAAESPGSRFTIEAGGAWLESLLKSLGYRLVRRVRKGEPAYCQSDLPARARRASSFWAVGAAVLSKAEPVDYEALEEAMDPLDRAGAVQEPKSAKEARSYMEIPWERRRWDIGLPDELHRMMAEKGVGIYPSFELGASEVPFYKWASTEGLARSIIEADRAIIAGAMEYVPESRMQEVLESSTIHPWTIVDQGGGKWRLCHDYSVGTNKTVPTASFSMASAWEVAPIVRPGSHFSKYDIRDGFWHVPIADDSKKRLVVRHPGTGRLIWATRLPFGYLEAPRLFCAVTEAIASRLRKKAAGRGIHFYVFVDDYLVVGDTKELTEEGMAILEAEMAERGMMWAPHKKRGPCQCIEFLGLLLSNVGSARGITLSKKRMGRTLRDLAAWQDRESGSGEVQVAEPRELASFLGKLVFASQVVRGGRTYMQGMLAQFKGLVVDWRRGAVSAAGGKWGPVRLTAAFWRDLEWWRGHLEGRGLTPFEGRGCAASGVLAGTDASGWGTGQVIWLDGAREESVLRFTAAEKRRPINWRELLGVVRVCEVWGARLRGRTLLIETDNMAAKGAAGKLSSKAADMQELVRRLYAFAEEYDFELRVTHTPGEKLDRPDQTSRGDAVEEPRARISGALFREAESRWGRFSSFIGAEREHARGSGLPVSEGGRRLWVHPTISTVGSALRRIQEAMSEGAAPRAQALALIPDDDGAPWASMLKHGLTVGRVEGGADCLEMCSLGEWRPCRVLRPMRFVLFPRSAGARVQRVRLGHRESLERVQVPLGDGQTRVAIAGEGYTLTADGEGLRLPVLPGSFVYSLPEKGSMGVLCQVVEPEKHGEPDELCAVYMILDRGRAALKSASPVFAVASSGEFAGVYRPDPHQLWSVDHLVSQAPGLSTKTIKKFNFDYEAANREIYRAGGSWGDRECEWTLLSPAASGASGYSPYRLTPSPMAVEGANGAVAGDSWLPAEYRKVQADGRSLPPTPGPRQAEQVEPAIDDWEEKSLGEVVADLDRMHLAQHVGKTGPEGAVAPRLFTARGGERAGLTGERFQLCQYLGISCGGCRTSFELGEKMVSFGNVLVHDEVECKKAAGVWSEEQAAQEEESAAESTTYYGVFTAELGGSGVYVDWAQAERLVGEEQAEEYGATFGRFASYAEAFAFVKAETLRCASGEQSSSEKGSLIWQRLREEKLSAARLEKVQGCIEGRCGRAHDASNSTLCKGGCGRRLHVAECAQLGKGYAALGNFTCVQCRLPSLTRDAAGAAPALIRTVTRTMILELSQGAESTAAGYADFAKLELRYVQGMGGVLDGGGVAGGPPGLLMPRHNVEAFKNFATWLATDGVRGTGLESTIRAAGAFLTKSGLTDHTKNKSFQAHLKELISRSGKESVPTTAATARMLKLMVGAGGLCDSENRMPFLAARVKVQAVTEGVGGCRISEVANAGDCHGALANNTAILETMEGGLFPTVVEVRLEHSKTNFSRYLDMAGTTLNSNIQVAKCYQEYWKLAGFPLVSYMQSGVKVTRPDFWVVRVSLMGIENDKELRKLFDWAYKSKLKSVKEHAKDSEFDGKRRYLSDSEEKSYINVAGGGSRDRDLDVAVRELTALGFKASKMPGPLLLSTRGGGLNPRLGLMPLSTSRASEVMSDLLEKAWVKANKDPMNPDEELDLVPGQRPKWGTHALRRLANTTAMKYKEEMGFTDAEQDIYFGWHEKVLRKAMQNHYNAMSIHKRMEGAKITGAM